MAKTLVVCGHGPGISDAVARKFGLAGLRFLSAAQSDGAPEQGAGERRNLRGRGRRPGARQGDRVRFRQRHARAFCVAGKFWNLYETRAERSVTIG